MVAVVWLEVDSASGYPISVDYETVDGTAQSGSDHLPSSGTVVLSAGETEHQILVATVRETEPESNESLTVGLSNQGNAVLQTPEVAVTICDDDGGECIFGYGFESGETSEWSRTAP